MNKFREIIAVIIGLCVFFFASFEIIEIYKELAGYDLLAEQESGYTPPTAGIMKYIVSASFAGFIGGMIYDNVYRISNFDESLYDIFLFACGSLIFVIFNLIKELALIPYVDNGFIEFFSFAIDILVIFGLYWSFNQVKKLRRQ